MRPLCRLTDAEELRVHAVEVGDEDDAERPRGVEEQEVPRRQVEDQASAVHHQQTDLIHGHHHPEGRDIVRPVRYEEPH